MKRIYVIILIWLVSFTGASAQSLEHLLDSLSAIYSFSYEKMEVDSNFTSKYLLQFEQAVDPDSPAGQTFRQRVFLSHKDFDAPVVFITEGYTAWHAEKPDFTSELAGLLNSNQICVEHRYFGTSVPDTLVWDQLTVAHAAADHHRIVQVLKNLYKGKWISTGISKGGQTTVYFRYFYPEDVDISVPYVAPLNFSTEDQRVYLFLDQVDSEECRDKIRQFQTELIKNKAAFLPAFEKLANEKGLTYRMGIEKAFELTVLEYSFAFWQWGYFTCNDIPQDFTEKDSIIKHLDKVAGLKWISNEGIEELQPFFYQAMREMGFYGYDITPFKEWISFTKNPTFEFTLPEGVHITYEPELNEQADCFVRHEAENMIFIYGANDPWSAPAVQLTYHTNSIKMVKPGGSHRTRIKDLTEGQQKQVMDTLSRWLDH